MIAAVFNADLLVLPNSVRSRVPLGKPFIAKLTEQEQREVIRFIGAGKPLPDDLLGTKRTPSRSAPFQRRLIQVWGTFRLSPPSPSVPGRPRRKKKQTSSAILAYLALKGIFHYRSNSGPFVFPETATTARRFIKAGALGSPDIVCVINGQYVGIEVKGAKGRQSDNQKEFQRRLEAAGGKYVLAYSLDDVLNAFPKAA
jgi:hypothetical protein